MKRVKVFDNQDDLYQTNQKQDVYEEDKGKVIDCAHLMESEEESSGSESSEER